MSDDDFVQDIVDGLPESESDLWCMRPVLGHVHDAAHSRGISADALLGTVLARVSAATPVGYLIPPMVAMPASLNTFVCLVGPPGSSKSAAHNVARELIFEGAEIDGIGISSGEGLIELYMGEIEEADAAGKTKVVRGQAGSSALVVVDEGTVLTEVAGRKGNTAHSHLRSMWTGNDVGQANASKDRYRFLQAHTYRLALIIGLQPANANGLLDDAGGGLPQRFVWCAAHDHTIPPPGQRPEWPGPIKWTPPQATEREFINVPVEVELEVQENHYRRQLGEDMGLDAHADLVCLKLAAHLATLDGRPAKVTTDDWEIAKAIHRRSTVTRNGVVDTLAEDARRKEEETVDRSEVSPVS